MTVSLQKGQKIDLTKGNPGLTKIVIGLGWDVRKYEGGSDFDLDASVFLLGANDLVTKEEDLIFYNNLESKCKSVKHMGDNLIGGGDGDSEQVIIELAKVPFNIQKIAFAVTIHEAEHRKQNFGMVSNSYVRVINEFNNLEILRYDLGEEFSIETAVVVGEVYRYNNEWKFSAVGSGFKGGLSVLCRNFGIDV